MGTSAGDVWFKEPAPALAFEPALTLVVEGRCPGFAPEVLAAEGARLLTRDAGPQLRSLLRRREPAPSWDELLPLYAELQLSLAGDLEPVLALGIPDKRPAAVAHADPELVERIHGPGAERTRLRALEPALRDLAGALEDPLPPTVVHEEVHEGNVFVRDARPRLLDWGEAAASHPFAGLVNTFRDIAYRRRLRPDGREMLRLREVYLEPWGRFAPPSELRESFTRGYLLGTLCRAMSWDRILSPLPSPPRDEYERNAVVWLDIFREGVESGVRVGAS